MEQPTSSTITIFKFKLFTQCACHAPFLFGHSLAHAYTRTRTVRFMWCNDRWRRVRWAVLGWVWCTFIVVVVYHLSALSLLYLLLPLFIFCCRHVKRKATECGQISYLFLFDSHDLFSFFFFYFFMFTFISRRPFCVQLCRRCVCCRSYCRCCCCFCCWLTRLSLIKFPCWRCHSTKNKYTKRDFCWNSLCKYYLNEKCMSKLSISHIQTCAK